MRTLAMILAVWMLTGILAVVAAYWLDPIVDHRDWKRDLFEIKGRWDALAVLVIAAAWPIVLWKNARDRLVYRYVVRATDSVDTARVIVTAHDRVPWAGPTELHVCECQTSPDCWDEVES